MAPKIDYHKAEDILSFRFSNAKSVDSDIQGNVVVDYDKKGNIVRLDIMKVNLDNFVPLRQLQRMAVQTR